MVDLLTSGAYTIAPTLVLWVTSRSDARTRVHTIAGSDDVDVTLRSHGPRQGVVELGFAGPTSEADSLAAEELLRAGLVWTLRVEGRSTLGRSIVASGVVERELEPETRDQWVVRVDYTEVRA